VAGLIAPTGVNRYGRDMRRFLSAHLLLLATALLPLAACAPATATPRVPTAAVAHAVPAPADIIGFEPGEDYKLADTGQLLAYYERLAAASERVELVEIGRSTQDRPMVLLYISAPANLARLDRWRETSRRLGRAEGLTDEEARQLAREGKAIVWIDAGLHSTEVAHSQHAPHLAFHLATDRSEETLRILDDVVLLLMPLMNPDGHEIVVDWYRRNLGTPYETTRPPEVYHEYVGHDINRDWYMFRQQETRVVGRILYEEWLPQIIFNHHQTAPFPARIFIPPFADPVNPHIDPRVIRAVNLVGEHMAHRFEMERMPGVVTGITFTMWWNGGMRTAPYFHNQVGILSEVGHASATPRDHDPAEFPATFGRGLPTLEPTIRYPNPWRGGRASLGEAVRYHLVASLGTLDVAQKNREDFLHTFYRMGRDAIQAGEAGGPFAYVVVMEDQHDRGEALELVTALRRGGIEVERAVSPFEAGGRTFPAGSYVLRAGQAFRAHLVDLLEPQRHPHRELYPGGPPEPPYGGLAGYTLSMQMGVTVARVDQPFLARTEPVDPVPPPSAVVTGSGDVFLVSPRENRAFTALYRLLDAGARVRRAEAAFTAGDATRPAGTLVVEAAAAGTEAVEAVIREAGVVAWRTAAVPPVPLRPVGPARIGIYRPWVANMDEGWTRWLLGHYGIPFRTLTDQDIQGGGLADVDALLLTSQPAQSILRGHQPGRMPEPYTGGLGEAGVRELHRWVEAGGRLVALDQAVDFVLHHFDVPVGNALAGLRPEEFYIPGSLIRIEVEPEHAVGFGMAREAAAFFQNSRAFDLAGPGPEVVARYGARDLLLSGWEVGADEHLGGKAAVVRVPYGAGDVVLIGFRAQFRAQPAGTFKLLFNALQGAGA
jgi:hypothetical protein